MKISKSQSAMEYLMTYGWAVLVVLVVITLLFSYSYIPRSDKFSVNRCVFQSGIVCIDYKVENDPSDNGVIKLAIYNSHGHDMTDIVVTTTDCGVANQTDIPSGENAIVTVNCSQPLSGSKYSGEVNITYINPVSGLTHTIQGSISTTIDETTSVDTIPPVRSN